MIGLQKFMRATAARLGHDNFSVAQEGGKYGVFLNDVSVRESRLAEAEIDLIVVDAEALPDIVFYPDINQRQFRIALKRHGFRRAQIIPALEAIADEELAEDTQIAFEYSPTFKRAESMIEVFRVAMGFTVEQLDTLWLEAGEL